MLRISSREYKLMLWRQRFGNLENALNAFRATLEVLAKSAGRRLNGGFESKSERRIDFRDTQDQRLAKTGLVLRFRQRMKRDEITLKCRTPDRYIAADLPIATSGCFDSEQKFEEDVARPFVSRFSHSTTVQMPPGKSANYAGRLKDLCRVFPGLKRIKAAEGSLSSGKLLPVSKIQPIERVHTGPSFRIEGEAADVALILWYDPVTKHLLLSEFSFRYSAPKEMFSGRVARIAQDLFSAMQSSDWLAPNSQTKTQFVFEGASHQ